MSVLCLVPSPLLASRATRRLCDAQDGVLLGPAVSTFDRVAAGILAEAGDRRVILSPLAERLVASDAAREAGGPFDALAPAGGIAAAVAAALAELRRGNVSVEDAERAAAELEGAPRDRLAALAAALRSYEARLERLSALDRAGAAREAAAAIRRRGPRDGPGADLLVLDGFAALAPGEWDLFAALAARARRTRAHVPFFPERPDLCAPAEPLLRRLEALHELTRARDVEVDLPRLEGRPGRLAALLAAFAGGAAGHAAEGGTVHARTGAGEDGEAEVVARLVADLAADGFAPGDIAVLAPAPRSAGPRLAAAFGEVGVPFASGRGGLLAEAPPVRAVREALGAAANGLSRRAAERLAASSYLAAGPGVAGLGRLLDRAGALDGRLRPAGALRRRAAALAAPAATREREALERGAAALDGIEAGLRALRSPGTPREHAARLAAWIDAAGVRRRAARGERETVARDLAALAHLEEAAEGLAGALALAGRGAERLGAGAWVDLVDVALASATLPPAGEPAAGAVELSAHDEAAAVSARAAVVIGCARGAFPATPPPEALLREPERAAINRTVRRAAVPTAAARRAAALHAAFCAAAAGTDAVAFTWPSPGATGGGPPAPLVVEALAAAGVAPPAPASDVPLAAARTARDALRAAARLGRGGAGDAALAALRDAGLDGRAASALARGAVEAERREAVRAGTASPFAGALGAEGAAALSPTLPREWSPTQLEGYARCPFRLFLSLGIGLEDAEGTGLDIDGRDEGRLLHAILERFVRGRTARGAWPPSGGDADRAEARAAAAEVLDRFEREGRVGDPSVWAARREGVLARVERIVAAEAEAHDGLAPALLEHAFGGRSGRPPLALEAGGTRVLVRGRIDRVDASPAALRVIDYKSSADRARHAAQLAPEALGTTSFQVPLYLAAAARDLPGRARHEATFVLLREPRWLPPVALDPADLRAGAGEGDPGRPLAEAVADIVARIRAGDFPLASLGCEHCPFGAVCRSEGVADRGAAEASA